MQKRQWWYWVVIPLISIAIGVGVTLLLVRLHRDGPPVAERYRETPPCLLTDEQFNRIFAKEIKEGKVTTISYPKDSVPCH